MSWSAVSAGSLVLGRVFFGGCDTRTAHLDLNIPSVIIPMGSQVLECPERGALILNLIILSKKKKASPNLLIAFSPLLSYRAFTPWASPFRGSFLPVVAETSQLSAAFRMLLEVLLATGLVY